MSSVNTADLSLKSKTSPIKMSGSIGALILILTGSFVGAAPSPEVPSFSKTYSALQRLSRNTGESRQGWLQIIREFLSIHETGKDRRMANQSLFLAGKASLELYRRSGKPGDLDTAIRHLSRFSNLNRRGPYLIMGLRELKEAHSLKRKSLDLPSQKANDANKVNSGRRRTNDDLRQLYAQPAKKGGPEAAADRSANTLSTRQDSAPRASHNYVGNPFSDSRLPNPNDFKLDSSSKSASVDSKRVSTVKSGPPLHIGSGAPDSTLANPLPLPTPKTTGHELSSSVKSASLPSPTVNDGFTTKKIINPSAKEFVVAIDPGHGGKDPGAVSQDGCLKEKDLTLEIAKKLKTTLESRNPPLKVVLTRSDNRHLSLEDRVALANAANADLFISIHCNAAEDSGSKGIETYYLSKASSRGAMRVAARENGIPLSKMSDIEATLVDLMVTSKKSESAKLAISVHGSLSLNQKGVGTSARNRGVRQAPFYVLLGAKMPSILVECAFISNKRERRKLTNPAYVTSIADRIAEGAANYLKGLDGQG
jgi:N-acetylmuramoyl-L-alanine amidase